jgi:hypothetical protein
LASKSALVLFHQARVITGANVLASAGFAIA